MQLSNLFHFMIESVEDLQATNSASFRVIADESEWSTISQSSSTKLAATTADVSTPISPTSTETLLSTTAPSSSGGPAVGLGVG